MKSKFVKKIVLWIVTAVLAALFIFVAWTCIYHIIRSSSELAALKERGFYNPVSVGDYSLNVAMFGSDNPKHTIVAMAGLGMGDCSVAMRQMTALLEEENLVVFVDRAGYGFSDDTNNEMTLEYIVEDYRKALSNAGLEAPYILLPHSIGGAYANYWSSIYPEEIEAILFVDGSQLNEDAFSDEPTCDVTLCDRFMAVLAKMGFSRYVLRDYFYHYPDNYSEEEQYLGDALTYMTLDSIAPVSESALLAENAQKAFNWIVTNDIPKLYICASWGIKTEADLIEANRWINRQIEINDLDIPPRALEYPDEAVQEILGTFEKSRQDIIYPYAERMGNCQVVCLAGDHMIYEQNPDECSRIAVDFINSLS